MSASHALTHTPTQKCDTTKKNTVQRAKKRSDNRNSAPCPTGVNAHQTHEYERIRQQYIDNFTNDCRKQTSTID